MEHSKIFKLTVDELFKIAPQDPELATGLEYLKQTHVTATRSIYDVIYDIVYAKKMDESMDNFMKNVVVRKEVR